MDEEKYIFNEEDSEEGDGFYDLYKGYQGESPHADLEYLPSFSYLHIDIGKTKYHFHRPEFDVTDRCFYFEKLKTYSKSHLHHLVYDAHHHDRFILSHNINDPEFKLVSDLFGIEIKEENRPIIGHFRLYHVDLSKQDLINIKNGGDVKNPRIFFLLDKQCLCHILFYDPFHKVHPMAESTLNNLLKQFE